MKKVLLVLLGLLVFPCSKIMASGSQSVSATISSVSFATGGNVSQSLLLNPNESISYSLTGSATGTIRLEKTTDGTNWQVVISSTNNSGGTRTGTEYSNDRVTRFRWRASTMAGAGFFQVTLTDNDDFVANIVNRKYLPTVTINDDSVNVNGNVNSSGAQMSTTTTSGNSTGHSKPIYLIGTVAAVEGNVIVATTPVYGQGVTGAVGTATADLTTWIGVAKSAASTGTLVDVYYDGFVLARTTGTVNPGDTLVTTSNAAGYLAADTTPTTGADVGVALGSGVAGGGLTKIKLR